MQFKTLLSKEEVKKYAGLPASFPPCDVKDIAQIELSFLRECFGADLHEKLTRAVVDYSSVQKWMSGTFQADAIVSNYGTYWKAVQTTTSEPISESEFWSIAPKFEGDCASEFENAWCLFLAPLLSLKIAKVTAGISAVNLSASGITIKTGDGFVAASNSERALFFSAIDERISRYQSNFEYWAKKNTSGCFPVNTECGCENSCSKQFAYGAY
jgi:hypothetical protein